MPTCGNNTVYNARAKGSQSDAQKARASVQCIHIPRDVTSVNFWEMSEVALRTCFVCDLF